MCYANEESDPQNIKILANTESRISLEILEKCFSSLTPEMYNKIATVVPLTTNHIQISFWVFTSHSCDLLRAEKGLVYTSDIKK